MADPVPVALARLTDDARVKPEHVEPRSKAGVAEPKERRPFSELPYAQQAAMRCNEPDFENFLYARQGPGGILKLEGWGSGDTDAVAAHVRYLCGVKSRSEIIKGTPAGDKWSALEAEYYAMSRGMR